MNSSKVNARIIVFNGIPTFLADFVLNDFFFFFCVWVFSVSGNLTTLDVHTPDTLQNVVKLLRTILVENGHGLLETTPAIRELLAIVLEIYQRGKFPKEIRTRVLIMLCDIVLDHKLCVAYGQNIFSTWLPTLPKLLCQPYVSPHILKTFSHLARQRNPQFLAHLADHQQAILGKNFLNNFWFFMHLTIYCKFLFFFVFPFQLQQICHKFKLVAWKINRMANKKSSIFSTGLRHGNQTKTKSAKNSCRMSGQ